MTDQSRKNASKTRGRGAGRPFAKGNPGRPRGARHKATVAAEALFDGEAEALTRKGVEMALAGDSTVMRLCLDRILPLRRGRLVNFNLSRLHGAGDAAEAMAALTGAVAAAEITPGEAAELAKLVEAFVRALEAGEFDRRLRDIEEWKDRGGEGRRRRQG